MLRKETEYVHSVVEFVRNSLTNLLSSGDLENHSGVCGYCSNNRSIAEYSGVVHKWCLFASNSFIEVHRHPGGYGLGFVDHPKKLGPRRRKFVRGLLLSLEREHPFSYVSVKFWEEFEKIDKET